MKINLSIPIIAILVTIILLLHFCKSELTVLTTTKTITIPGDKVPVEIKVPVPVPYQVLIHDTVPAYQKIDTAEILERYFARALYRDTIKVDSSFLAIIQEIISQNRIVSRQVWTQNLRAQQIVYQTIIAKNKGIFIGPQVSYGTKPGIGAGGIYLNGNTAFGCNIDLVNRSFGLTYYLKL